MKITLITPIYNKNSRVGMSRYTSILKEGSEKAGHKINIISFSQDKIKKRVDKIINKLFDFKAIKDFIKSIKEKSEIYHFICPELMYYPLAAVQMFLIKNILRKKIVLTLHDLMTLEQSEGKKLSNKIVNPLIKKLIKNSDALIANSKQTKEEFVKKLYIPEEKITVAELGVEKEFIHYDKKTENLTLGYYGAFDKVEDPIFALKSYFEFRKFKSTNETKMEVFGIGPELDNVIKTVNKLKIKNIDINGFSPEDSSLKEYDPSSLFLFPVDTYNSFDVYLFPSKYEGFGLNIVEAAACGIPIIIRKNSRITPEVRELCIEATDEEDMAEKAYKLYKDKRYKERTVKKLMKDVRKFSWDKNVEKTLEVYKRILK